MTFTPLRATLAAIVAAMAGTAWGQAYPNKPIRLLVGFSAGGSADVSSRIVATRLGQALGTTIVVENRAGAAGSVAAQIVARAPADGYTLFWSNTGALTVNRILEKNLPYDPDKAFTPVGLALTFYNVLIARQDSPVNSVAQLFALAKDKPGHLNYGSQGIGSAGFLSGELMQLMAGIKLTHVPYKGGNDVAAAVLGGELQLAFVSTTIAAAIRNRIKLLAVTHPTRDPSFSDVPSLDEAGLKNYDATFWFGVSAPTGTPPAVINRLNAALRETVSDAATMKPVQSQGLNPVPSTPQELAARIRTDYEKWKKVLEAPGARAG